MKNIIALLCGLLTFSCVAQTNVLEATLNQVPKTKKTGCGAGYFFVGVANFRASGIQPTNKWYYPTTDVLTIQFPTNVNPLITAGNNFGEEFCGHSSITWTDALWAQHIYQFSVDWSNNVPPPTNQIILLTAIGFRTNGP